VQTSSPEYAAQVQAQAQEHLERVHGIRVTTRDILAPLVADLDGAEIHIVLRAGDAPRSGHLDMDRWFSDYGACDEAYLLHWYRTGERREFRSFWRDDAPPAQPKPVPPFTPEKRRFRLDDVVI